MPAFAQTPSPTTASTPPPALGFAVSNDSPVAAPVAVSMRQRAGFACFTIYLATEAKDIPSQLADLRTSRQQVSDALRTAGAARVDSSVGGMDDYGSGGRWMSGGGSATGGGWLSLVSSVSKSYSGPAELAQLRALFPIKDDTDLLEVLQRVQTVVQTPRKPERLRVSASGIILAVLEPEQYRGDLLARIAAQMLAVKSALGPAIPPEGNELRVTGLESPVLVRAVGGPWVDLFLPYTFSLATR